MASALAFFSRFRLPGATADGREHAERHAQMQSFARSISQSSVSS
jgi:hypothetical protein